MLRLKKISGVCLLLFVVSCCSGAGEDYLKADSQALGHWQDLRFGMFVHWGPVSLKGQEISWSRGGQIPIEEYDQLYKQFNPELFNAEEWVKIAKDAGMKYIVFTSKHHAGFCMWPSEYTDYDIAAGPFKRDIIKELKDACRKYGIELGLYYSTCDWHHRDFPKTGCGGAVDNPNANLARYSEYLENQTRELVKNYGPLLTIWFDVPYGFTPEYGMAAMKMLRRLQPTILINNRIYAGLPQPVGDYDTPEQCIGGFNRSRPWESCMTICNQWAWKPNDQMKSLKDCIQKLISTAGGDGNFLFNVGPMPDGRIEPRQAQRLKEMGQWVKKYRDGIYGTRGGPFRPGKWGASTCKGDKIYLYIMDRPGDGVLELPGIPMEITSSKVLSGGKANVVQASEKITIDMAGANSDDIATVIELTVAGKAFDIKPVIKIDSVSFGKSAKASNFFQNDKEYDPAKAFDEDSGTRWATDGGVKTAWLEVDLGSEMTIRRALIDEGGWNRVGKFELQYKDGDNWKTFYTGSTIGSNKEITFEAVKGRYFRLNILESSDGPTIMEFKLFTDEPKGK